MNPYSAVEKNLNYAMYFLMRNMYHHLRVPFDQFKYGEFGDIKSIKEIFLYSEHIFEQDQVIGPVIDKIATQAVTELNIIGQDAEWWNDVLKEEVGLREKMIETAIDYAVYGNAMRTIIPPRKNMLKCKNCGRQIDPLSVRFDLKAGNDGKLHIYAKCPHCGKYSEFELVSHVVKDSLKFKVFRFNPYLMEIDYIESANLPVHYYKIAPSDMERIYKGDSMFFSYSPRAIIEAVLNRRSWLRLNPNIFIHFARLPHFGFLFRGWGKPMMMRLFKEYRRLEMLAKASEVIARIYSVPFFVFFPQPLANMDPSRLPLRLWIEHLNRGISRHRKDPTKNAIALPFPTGVQTVGPTATQISLTPEINNARMSMVPALGVPSSFYQGGGTWAGASVNMRLVFNTLESFRRDMSRFTDFVIKIISNVTGREDNVRVGWTPLKLLDEVARLKLYTQLVGDKKLSLRTLFTELGIDMDSEKDGILEELDNFYKPIQEALLKMQSDLQEGQAEQAQAQMQAQQANPQAIEQGAQAAEQLAAQNPEQAAIQIAHQLLTMPKEQAKAYLEKLERTSEPMFEYVMKALEAFQEQMKANGEQGKYQSIPKDQGTEAVPSEAPGETSAPPVKPGRYGQ